MQKDISVFQFNYLAGPFYFPRRKDLKLFLLKLAEREGYRVEQINYVFCTDAYLLEINQAHLNHDTLTDIITFPYSSGSSPLVADIYISIDRVRDNASYYKTTFSKELLRVMFHGLLHLCGYKDKSKMDIRLMREKENLYLQLWISRGTSDQ